MAGDPRRRMPREGEILPTRGEVVTRTDGGPNLADLRPESEVGTHRWTGVDSFPFDAQGQNSPAHAHQRRIDR